MIVRKKILLTDRRDNIRVADVCDVTATESELRENQFESACRPRFLPNSLRRKHYRRNVHTTINILCRNALRLYTCDTNDTSAL